MVIKPPAEEEEEEEQETTVNIVGGSKATLVVVKKRKKQAKTIERTETEESMPSQLNTLSSKKQSQEMTESSATQV